MNKMRMEKARLFNSRGKELIEEKKKSYEKQLTFVNGDFSSKPPIYHILKGKIELCEELLNESNSI